VRAHAGFVVVAAFVLTGLWALSGAHFFWPLIPLVFLFIGLKRHVRGHHHGYHHDPRRPAPWNAPGYR
jgi:hypothetical protein